MAVNVVLDPMQIAWSAPALTDGNAFTTIVPVAFTEPQPPVKGIL